MDPETKKAAEFCRIASVGHVVASKPPLKPLVRYRTTDRLPDIDLPVQTSLGIGAWLGKEFGWDFVLINFDLTPTWWAYLPEGDE